MSYILEALRKVERQRRGRAIPDLATVHGPSAAGRRIWVPVVSGVLLVNAGLLALLLWYRPETPPAPSPTTQAEAPAADAAGPPPAASDAPASAAAAAAVPPGSPPSTEPAPAVVASAPSTAAPVGAQPAEPVSAPPAPPASASNERRIGGPEIPDPGSSVRTAESGPRVRITVPGSDAAREVEVARGAAAGTPAPPPSAGSAGASVKAAVPADLPPSFRAAVSQLRLEALVYAQSPGDRKVFINGRRYLEGETLDGGILVEKIVEEGALLSYRDHRYVLRHFR